MVVDTAPDYYVSDDAKMIGEFISNDWALGNKLKPEIHYKLDSDMDTYSVAEGKVQCTIMSDRVNSIGKGIGYDGISTNRTISIYLLCRSSESVMTISNEIERIMMGHRKFPGNGWYYLLPSFDAPIYPFRKLNYRVLSYTLVTPWKPIR